LRFIWRNDADLARNIFKGALQRHFPSHEVDKHFGEICFFHITFTFVIINFLRMGDIKEDHSATEDSRQIRDGQRSAPKSN
jgi:hypothetical protein